MSLLSAAANDEDGDDIKALRAENEQLRKALIAMHDTLEMTARAGASYASANEVLRDTVIRWASRAEQAEDMLEAIGAGGVGKLEQPQVQSGGIPPNWKLVPVNITDAMYDAWADDDGDEWTAWKALLAAAPQPPVVELPETVPVSAYDRLQALCDSQASRIMEFLDQPQIEQEPAARWPANASEVRAFLSGHVAAERYARDDHQPDDNDTYTLSAHDLLGAIYWWTDFDPQPKREPLTDEQIEDIDGEILKQGHSESHTGMLAFARAIERAHGIGS